MEMVPAIRRSLPSDWASATVGSSRTASELKIVEGNRINGEGDILGIKLENCYKRQCL